MKEDGNLLGVANFRTGRYAEAGEALRDVLSVDKCSVMDMANLGVCCKLLGRRDEARHYLEAALELDDSLDFARRHLDELLDDGEEG